MQRAVGYPLPLFLNYVGDKLEDAIVGGSPGEDLATYLRNCPHVAIIGVNLYTPPKASLNDFRSALSAYRLGRNLPAVTETNSDRCPVATRSAYRALGEFGVRVSGMNNGQAIIIHPSGHNFLVLGFRCWITFHDSTSEWPTLKRIRVERGSFSGNQWQEEQTAAISI